MAAVLPRLYLITDRLLAADERDYLNRIEQALAAGVGMLQLREKDLSARELFRLGQQLRQLSRRYGASLLINERVDLALAVEADGVHLPENSLPTSIVRKLLGPQRLIGVSTHNIEQINQQAADGADFVTFGPVYATPSKSIYGPPQGLTTLGNACQQAGVPIYALGGINVDRVAECRQAGASGVAVISAILASDHPGQAAQNILRQF